MRKKISIAVLIVAIIILLISIDRKFLTYRSYIYALDDDENVKVTLKIKDGYRLNGKNFTLGTKFHEDCTVGQFLEKNVYDALKEKISTDSNIKVIEEDTVNNLRYILYTENDTYVYLVKMIDADIYFTLTNDVSVETAIKIFNRFTIEKV